MYAHKRMCLFDFYWNDSRLHFYIIYKASIQIRKQINK